MFTCIPPGGSRLQRGLPSDFHQVLGTTGNRAGNRFGTPTPKAWHRPGACLPREQSILINYIWKKTLTSFSETPDALNRFNTTTKKLQNGIGEVLIIPVGQLRRTSGRLRIQLKNESSGMFSHFPFQMGVDHGQTEGQAFRFISSKL